MTTSSIELFDITIDSKLNFKEHIDNIMSKACYKIYVLRRRQKSLKLIKARILVRSMIESTVTFCLLIWMFCSETGVQRVEKVQYKILQVVYNNYMATYDDL